MDVELQIIKHLARDAQPTVSVIDEYCQGYKDLFAEVRSYEGERVKKRWIFQMFQAVHLVRINGEKQVSNLTQERQEILQHLGKDCCQYYLMIFGG